MARSNAGGGHGSRVVVDKPIKIGAGAKGINPGWVGQKGQAQGSHTTRSGDSNYRGEPRSAGSGYNPVPYGNQVALNVKGGGPGTGRTLYGQSGVQGCHGTPAQGLPKITSTKNQWPDRR